MKYLIAAVYAVMAIYCFIQWIHVGGDSSMLWLAAEFVYGDRAIQAIDKTNGKNR